MLSLFEFGIREFLRDDVAVNHAALNERDLKILRLRFGLADGSCRTLAECASTFGVTRYRIQLILAQALLKIRDAGGPHS